MPGRSYSQGARTLLGRDPGGRDTIPIGQVNSSEKRTIDHSDLFLELFHNTLLVIAF